MRLLTHNIINIMHTILAMLKNTTPFGPPKLGEANMKKKHSESFTYCNHGDLISEDQDIPRF